MSKIMKKLNVEGMSCSHCEKTIMNTLGELNGISHTQVDLKGKTVTVEYEDSLLKEEVIVEAIEDAGYDVVKA